MPQFDGTGPLGAGPMTGRAFGSCGGRAGHWFGRGRGWFREFGIAKNLRATDRQQALKEEERLLQSDLEAVRGELEALRTKK